MSELGGINCFCGNLARVRTSWTKENPGRRFLSCANRDGGCRFFEWEDSPLCARSRVIIPGLLRRLNALEKENARLEKIACSLYFLLIRWSLLLCCIFCLGRRGWYCISGLELVGVGM
ncbi:DNA topoisomerase [Handroanthus impetiginosus]|uniref:DNA topoisomerase n=1 Tax=Handroanthus impetiginosus TaxID=429701 RepID=A0A2G9I875_9LAMI|nr:DNA topoisomerase [Handroanthus impetiginosus]